jgi:hypothetical protein
MSLTRQAMNEAKLHGLITARWGPQRGSDAPFPGGAGLRPDAPGHPAYVFVEHATHRSLGGVLAWALRYEAGDIHMLADADGETCALLARRAQPFSRPITVWRVQPPRVLEVEPGGFYPPPPLPGEAAPYASVFREVGIEPVVEHGVLTGEVLGLEVARVVDGRLEVGVGSQDRRARREVDPDGDPRAQLAGVVRLIRQYRTPSGPAHLANKLAAERWLRAVLVARPALVGAAWLAPLPPAVERTNLRTSETALAAGVDLDDRPVVVAASTGIDLDLVPAAADARRAAGLDEARLILALVKADAHPRTRQLAGALSRPAEVVTVPAGWKGLAGTL